jgi:hypothetical protein
MPDARTILVAAPELIPALRDRLGGGEHLLTFADSEPVRALQAIVAERPRIVALERLFAASPRGAALISRIKADRALDGTEIRILSHDTDYIRVSPRRGASSPKTAEIKRLDKGTRRAQRYRMRPGVALRLDDQPAQILDLSAIGAQLITAQTLKPKQVVSLLIGDPGAQIAVSARVVWAKLEVVRNARTCRAGVQFIAPDRRTITAFAQAHQAK